MLINLWQKLAKARMIQAAKRSRRTTLSCEDLESRTNPSTTHIVAASVEYGAAPIVSVYDGATSKLKFTVDAFESTFTGGVRVAVGDVNGDGTDDLIVGAGRGGSARVRVFSGVDGAPLQDFYAGDETNRGGATVAAADFDGDGKADLVVGAVKNGQEVIQILRGYDGQSLRTIQPFGAAIEGANVAAGDFDGDGTPDVAVGAGFGGGPRLTVVSGKTGDVLLNTFAYESTFRGGLQVAAGDLDGDGKVELVTAAGPGGGPRIIAFQGGSGDQLHSFFAYDDSSARNGVQVSVFDVDNDGTNDIVTANGPGQAPQLRAFNGTTLARLADPQYPGLPFGAIAVTPQNNVPVANADSATTHLNTAVVISVLGNDNLGDEPTTITAFDAASVEGGTVVGNGNGSFTYTPPAGFVGTDTFTYTITDRDGESATATVTITVTNNLPVANADSATTHLNTAVVISVLGNDNLGDEPTTITAFDAASVEGGTVVGNGNGSFTYTPPAGFVGTDSFTYTITDVNGETSTATVTITVTNNLPVANADSATTHMNTAVVISVLGNDNLGDEPTTITAFDAASVEGGTVVGNGNGSFTYTPPAGFVGTDSFTYTITDVDGESSTATVTITVTNSLPVANADSATTDVDVPIQIFVLLNDDLGDEPTTITAFDAVSVEGGTIVDNMDGTLTYTPPSGFSGSDSFTYTITDADGDISTATVTIDVVV